MQSFCRYHHPIGFLRNHFERERKSGKCSRHSQKMKLDVARAYRIHSPFLVLGPCRLVGPLEMFQYQLDLHRRSLPFFFLKRNWRQNKAVSSKNTANWLLLASQEGLWSFLFFLGWFSFWLAQLYREVHFWRMMIRTMHYDLWSIASLSHLLQELDVGDDGEEFFDIGAQNFKIETSIDLCGRLCGRWRWGPAYACRRKKERESRNELIHGILLVIGDTR